MLIKFMSSIKKKKKIGCRKIRVVVDLAFRILNLMTMFNI